MDALNERRVVADWIFDGCTHYHIENVNKEDERIYCDLGHKLEYGCLSQCVKCGDRQRENHYYG